MIVRMMHTHFRYCCGRKKTSSVRTANFFKIGKYSETATISFPAFSYYYSMGHVQCIVISAPAISRISTVCQTGEMLYPWIIEETLEKCIALGTTRMPSKPCTGCSFLVGLMWKVRKTAFHRRRRLKSHINYNSK